MTPRNRLDVRWAGALGVAAVVHGALVAVVLWTGGDERKPTARTATSAATALPALATVQLIDGDKLTVPKGAAIKALLTADGDSGFPGPASHPLPNADRSLPGTQAARLGGGAAGGPDTWTGRSDNGNLRQQIWNDPDRYRLARKRTSEARRSTESIEQARVRGFGARHRDRRARDGETHGQSGTDTGTGSLTEAPVVPVQTKWQDADPLLNQAPARRMELGTEGATNPASQPALVDTGRRANDTRRRGRTTDNVNVAGASNARNPMPMDLLRAQSGGTTSGTAGRRRGTGPSASGVRGAHGSGATTAAVPRGPNRISIRARRGLPYFRSMYQRVDRLIRYPEELALAMAQGQLVVHFTLLRDGQIRDLRIAKTSGYDAFDSEVRRALTRAAPFGRVPKAILDGAPAVTVIAPFSFANPMIR